MKKKPDCYSKNYQNQKQNVHPKKLSLNYYSSSSKDKKPSTCKTKTESHCRVNTMTSIIPKEVSSFLRNSTSLEKAGHSKKTLSSTFTDENCKVIISAYEQAIISLFSYFKENSEESQYKQIKSKFFNELEKNLLQIKSDKNSYNKSSTLSSSNSIMSLLQESKNKCCIKQRQFSYYQYTNKKKNNNFLSHKSLYTLSKPGKKVNSSSPDKQTINNKSFLLKYYSFNQNLSSSKVNKKLYLNNNITKNKKETFVNNTLSNFSGGNVIAKQLDLKSEQIKESNEDNLNQSHNSELLRKIKSSLDDNLKCFFDFSYENFLNKESERDNTNRSHLNHNS